MIAIKNNMICIVLEYANTDSIKHPSYERFKCRTSLHHPINTLHELQQKIKKNLDQNKFISVLSVPTA
jgi:hypothetical protein